MKQKAPIFFEKFYGHFKEETTDLITLPDENSEIFEVFSEFLYSGILFGYLDRLNRTFSCNESEIRWEMMEIVVFADNYGLTRLHDEVMSSWSMFGDLILSLDELKKITTYLVQKSSQRCKARVLFARMWALEILHHPEYDYPNGTNLKSFINDSNFATQVINEMTRQSREQSSDGMLEAYRVCNYHLHRTLDLCCDRHLRWPIHPTKPVGAKAVDAAASAPKPAKKRKSA
jgi:peroxiredoxin family protein